MLERYTELLEATAASGRPVSVGDLVRMSGLPRATVYRLASSLEETGLLNKTEDGNFYEIGYRLRRLNCLGLPDQEIRNAVRDLMIRAAEKWGETIFMGRMRGVEVELILAEVPRDNTQAHIYPGLGLRPLHACSSAKAILAFKPAELVASLMAEQSERFTEQTLTGLSEVVCDLQATRARGFGLCDEEIDQGVLSLAVPIMDEACEPMFSIGLVGPAARMRERGIEAMAKDLEQVATRSSERIRQLFSNVNPVERH